MGELIFFQNNELVIHLEHLHHVMYMYIFC